MVPIETGRRGWHFEKTVSVGHLITTVTIILAALAWTSSVDKELAIHTTQIIALQETDKRHEIELTTSRSEIVLRLQNIDEKLDRYIIDNRTHAR